MVATIAQPWSGWCTKIPATTFLACGPALHCQPMIFIDCILTCVQCRNWSMITDQ